MRDESTLSNPYPGLRPFEPDENYLFFGRDGQSNELLRRLRRNHFLAVVGTSGSGKSSLVRAGLLPDLQSGMLSGASSHWRIAIMRPGGDPIGNLAAALCRPGVLLDEAEQPDDLALSEAFTKVTLQRSALGIVEAVRQAHVAPGENVLIVVDQFEELFRFKAAGMAENAAGHAAAFVKLLLGAAKQTELPLYVIITMRSDFLGDAAQFRDLPETINDGQYLIPRMTRDERREAITGPAAVGGGRISPRLLQRLLNDVGDNPDQLPILQHALMRTWDHWQVNHPDDKPIDVPDYETVGGMVNSLSHHADEAYDELAKGETAARAERRQWIAERMFKCLTEKGADNREIRHPMRLGDIAQVVDAEQQEVVVVIDVFRMSGRSFLMPPVGEQLTKDTLIDISHESLIRNWHRLKTWVAEEARSATTYRRLANTAELHKEGKAGYYRNPELLIAKQWQEQERPNASWSNRYHPAFEEAMGFLAGSQRADRGRRLAMWGSALAVILIVAAVGAFLYNQDQNEATQHLVDTLANPTTSAGGVSAYLEQLKTYSSRAIPKLQNKYDDASDADESDRTQKLRAACGLIELGKIDPDKVQLLLDSIPTLAKDEGPNLIRALEKAHEQSPLSDELRNRVAASNLDAERNRYLAVELSLGITEAATAACQLEEDPSSRTSFIHGFKEFPSDLTKIAELLASELDRDLRSALCLAVGGLGTDAAQATEPVVKKLYVEAADPGTHSASRWALQQQGVTAADVSLHPDSHPESPTRQWYVDRMDITMLKVPGGEFVMGSGEEDAYDDEKPHKVTISEFWLSDREVSVGLFNALMKDVDHDPRVSPTPDHPVQQVSWHQAARFCNWLSEWHKLPKEQWCYESINDVSNNVQMRIRPEFLKLEGYRLPTEAEWEYACRAGTTTDYAMGNDTVRLPDYAVFASSFMSDSAEKCGSKLPNSWGLFDMHGNVWEWCQDWYGEYRDESLSDPTGPSDGSARVGRGGSWGNGARGCRSASRGGGDPESRDGDLGFRVARSPSGNQNQPRAEPGAKADGVAAERSGAEPGVP